MYSFTNYRGYGDYDRVGFRNYKDLFTDLKVGKSYLFTFKYALVGTVLVNVLSLIMALGLNNHIRFKSALRGIYFVPNILGGLVIGYIFSFFFTYIVPAVGSALNISWIRNSILASEKYAWIGVLIVGVWQAVATNTIIYISGLQTVPEDVYEASNLDGATKWQEFWKVTLPLVVPFLTINLVLSTKNLLMVFDQIMSLTKGGPAQSTESISYLIYRNGMDGGQFGFQSANAVIFPMMSPMHATVAILTALGTWNDVMTPLVIMSGTGINTLPLAQLNFQTQFGTNYNLAFASYILALIPILLFYIICQKQILNGVANGAVKG